MRLVFWRAGKDKAGSGRSVPMPELKPEPEAAPAVAKQASVESSDIDLRALGSALARKRGWIIVPTVLALML